MTISETFISFFVHKGLLDIGANIAKHMSAKDLMTFMQVSTDFEDFVMDNADIRWLFIKKAQIESRFEPGTFLL